MVTFYGTSGSDYYSNIFSRSSTRIATVESVLAYGYGGNDRLVSGDGNDTLDGGDGNDYLYSKDGDDLLIGGDGNDYLQDYYLGNDTLIGGAGNDYIAGGSGNDTFTGGTGADSFNVAYEAYLPTSSYDTITDFSRNEGDKIFVYGNRSDYSLDQTKNISAGSALDTAVYYRNDLIAVLQDTTQVSLAADFLFQNF
jgi:Ca2+-binding RTX toxin-like protein